MKIRRVTIPCEFVFTKLHSLWSLALQGEQLETMVLNRQEQGLQQAMAKRGVDSHNPAEVQKNLAAVMLAELDRIKDLLEPAAQAFYDRFISFFYFENLKTILRYRRQPDPGTDIRFLIIASPALPTLNVESLLAAQTVNQFYKLLPATAEKLELLPILLELEENHDLFAAEVSLDRLYFAKLEEQAHRLPLAMRGPALQLSQQEIDIFNLIVILRNAELYHLKAEAAATFFLPGGRDLTFRTFNLLFGMTDSGRITAALPVKYRKILAGLAGTDLYRRENALWNLLHDRVARCFRDFSNPAASVAAFPFLKYFEILNLGRIFEGFRFGLPPADIRSMIIGVPHV